METNLYNLPKDMLIKLITTIQNCKNLKNIDLVKNSQNNIHEVEARKLLKLKEFFLKNIEVEEIKVLIKEIEYIRIRVNENFICRMTVKFTNGFDIRAINITELRMFFFDKYNNDRCNVYHDRVEWKNNDDSEKYKNYRILIQTVLFPNFKKIHLYLNPFTQIDVDI